MNQNLEMLYDIYTNDFVSLIQNEQFYGDLMNKAQSGTPQVSFMHRFVDKQIDLAWVEMIEDCIIPLDTIIRNPRCYIAQEEEIIPIELARKITPESIRHLAQNTSIIAKVEDGEVTPNKILSIFKEENYATYENRFIYTLLLNLQYFIDKRLGAINSKATGENVASLSFMDEFQSGGEKIQYKVEITSSSPAFQMKLSDTEVDTTKLNKFARVERLRKILFDFQNSALIKKLKGCELVRPPIISTNVILKNPDFKKAKRLWDFIETYREAGFNVEIEERNEIPNEKYIVDIYSTLAINYILLKHHTGDGTQPIDKKQRKTVYPKFIERTFQRFLEEMSFDVDIIKNVYVNQIKKSSDKRIDNEKQIRQAIDKAISFEKARQKRTT